MSEFNFAFLDAENTVINIAVFDSENPDAELLENIKTQFAATDTKSCSVYGEAYVGGKFVDNKFIKPQPYPSWILNAETLEWEAPIGQHLENIPCYWDEETVSWKPILIIE
jgi:hypothetical protein